MLTEILIYLPFLIIAVSDFAIFSNDIKLVDEPEFWTKRDRRGADTALASKREDCGYGAS